MSGKHTASRRQHNARQQHRFERRTPAPTCAVLDDPYAAFVLWREAGRPQLAAAPHAAEPASTLA